MRLLQQDNIPIIPAIILFAIYVSIIFGFLYSGIRGLRGRQIALFNRGGVSRTAKGRAARVIGVLYLLMGLAMLIMPFLYAARQHQRHNPQRSKADGYRWSH